MFRNLTPQQLKSHLDNAGIPPILLDVREPWEYQVCRIEGSQHIPMGQILMRLHELDPQRETVVICHHGVRSLHVAKVLLSRGFENIINLAGGVDGWAKQVDPGLPTY